MAGADPEEFLPGYKSGHPIGSPQAAWFDVRKRLVSFEGKGQNPKSSALGIGQIVDDTWVEFYTKAFPKKAAGMDRGQMLALKTNDAVANTVLDTLAAHNMGVLQKAGVGLTRGLDIWRALLWRRSRRSHLQLV